MSPSRLPSMTTAQESSKHTEHVNLPVVALSKSPESSKFESPAKLLSDLCMFLLLKTPPEILEKALDLADSEAKQDDKTYKRDPNLGKFGQSNKSLNCFLF